MLDLELGLLDWGLAMWDCLFGGLDLGLVPWETLLVVGWGSVLERWERVWWAEASPPWVGVWVAEGWVRP